MLFSYIEKDSQLDSSIESILRRAYLTCSFETDLSQAAGVKAAVLF